MRVHAYIITKADELAMNFEGLVQPSFENFETFLLGGANFREL